MKRLALPILIAFISLPMCFGQGGDTVRNGGGLVENQFVYVWSNLSYFVRPCATGTACQLTSFEVTALERIRFVIEQGLRPLVFSEERPSATAGRPWAHTISTDDGRALVFRRNLYSDGDAVRAGGALHNTLPFLLAAAGALSSIDPSQGWDIGLKLRAFWDRGGLVLQGGSIGLNQIYFQTINGEPFLPGQWFVSDEASLIDLTPWLETKLLCPGPSRGRLLRTTNIDWTGPAAVNGSISQVEAAAHVEYSCEGHARRAEARVTLTFIDGIFNPRSSFIRVFDIHD